MELPPTGPVYPPTGRTRHPYFMHDMIRRQIVAAHATYRATQESLAANPLDPPDRQLVLTGLGTSLHAALATGLAARKLWGDGHAVRIATAFDLIATPVVGGSEDLACVFSASGETALTLVAQRRLREQKIPVVLFTARDASPSHAHADRVFVSQYADETSWTHTVSFTAGLVSAGAVLDQWAGGGDIPPSPEEAVAEAITSALATESKVLDLVEKFSECNRFLFVGSGLSGVTAREAALKFREAAGRFSAVVGVEEILHGVLPSVNEGVGVIAVSDTPFERARAEQGLAAAATLGAPTLLVDSSGGPGGDGILTVPHGDRPLAPVLQVIPLQLLAYWIAASEGHNPDVMGLDDPRQMKARQGFGI